MKNAQISDYFQRPNEHEGARNQTWPWKDKSSFAKSSACTQSFGTFGAFLEILVPEDAKQSMKMSWKCLRKKKSQLLENVKKCVGEVFILWVLAGQKLAKVVRRFFSPNFEKIASGLRPLSIFSKFGLFSVGNAKFWRLVYIGRLTGSGSAPQEADMGCKWLWFLYFFNNWLVSWVNPW